MLISKLERKFNIEIQVNGCHFHDNNNNSYEQKYNKRKPICLYWKKNKKSNQKKIQKDVKFEYLANTQEIISKIQKFSSLVLCVIVSEKNYHKSTAQFYQLIKYCQLCGRKVYIEKQLSRNSINNQVIKRKHSSLVKKEKEINKIIIKLYKEYQKKDFMNYKSQRNNNRKYSNYKANDTNYYDQRHLTLQKISPKKERLIFWLDKDLSTIKNQKNYLKKQGFKVATFKKSGKLTKELKKRQKKKNNNEELYCVVTSKFFVFGGIANSLKNLFMKYCIVWSRTAKKDKSIANQCINLGAFCVPKNKQELLKIINKIHNMEKTNSHYNNFTFNKFNKHQNLQNDHNHNFIHSRGQLHASNHNNAHNLEYVNYSKQYNQKKNLLLFDKSSIGNVNQKLNRFLEKKNHHSNRHHKKSKSYFNPNYKPNFKQKIVHNTNNIKNYLKQKTSFHGYEYNNKHNPQLYLNDSYSVHNMCHNNNNHNHKHDCIWFSADFTNDEMIIHQLSSQGIKIHRFGSINNYYQKMKKYKSLGQIQCLITTGQILFEDNLIVNILSTFKRGGFPPVVVYSRSIPKSQDRINECQLLGVNYIAKDKESFLTIVKKVCWSNHQYTNRVLYDKNSDHNYLYFPKIKNQILFISLNQPKIQTIRRFNKNNYVIRHVSNYNSAHMLLKYYYVHYSKVFILISYLYYESNQDIHSISEYNPIVFCLGLDPQVKKKIKKKNNISFVMKWDILCKMVIDFFRH
ncbi:hypothetical protein M0813_30285 [Anaeramoeba flamelloides]|uniref:Uncharacterized protein n=1 Tax=Anaeramoeba flamelloides TaxID=1746091 RepID=A0ABQ8XMD2_9EUKA|nr:hypothetical protein M0813_30285 [Anaeramoeba flamelloides]